MCTDVPLSRDRNLNPVYTHINPPRARAPAAIFSDGQSIVVRMVEINATKNSGSKIMFRYSFKFVIIN